MKNAIRLILVAIVAALLYTMPAQAEPVAKEWTVSGEFECDIVLNRNGQISGVENCELSDVEISD